MNNRALLAAKATAEFLGITPGHSSAARSIQTGWVVSPCNLWERKKLKSSYEWAI